MTSKRSPILSNSQGLFLSLGLCTVKWLVRIAAKRAEHNALILPLLAISYTGKSTPLKEVVVISPGLPSGETNEKKEPPLSRNKHDMLSRYSCVLLLPDIHDEILTHLCRCSLLTHVFVDDWLLLHPFYLNVFFFCYVLLTHREEGQEPKRGCLLIHLFNNMQVLLET